MVLIDINQVKGKTILKYLQCMVYHSDDWSMDKCKTLDVKTHENQDSTYVTCRCNAAGPIALGLVNTNETVRRSHVVFIFSKVLQFKYVRETKDISAWQ